MKDFALLQLPRVPKLLAKAKVKVKKGVAKGVQRAGARQFAQCNQQTISAALTKACGTPAQMKTKEIRRDFSCLNSLARVAVAQSVFGSTPEEVAGINLVIAANAGDPKDGAMWVYGQSKAGQQAKAKVNQAKNKGKVAPKSGKDAKKIAAGKAKSEARAKKKSTPDEDVDLSDSIFAF